MSTKVRGEIKYDSQYGHVCVCTEAVEYDDEGYPTHATYLPTVSGDRGSATESGSDYYSCSKCGARPGGGLLLAGPPLPHLSASSALLSSQHDYSARPPGAANTPTR